jgi:hypothetical protein
MVNLNGVKCARCRIPVQISDDTLSCPKCGVRDTHSVVVSEIAEQLHENKCRRLQDKVRNVLSGLKPNHVMIRPMTGQPYRFVADADDLEGANVSAPRLT